MPDRDDLRMFLGVGAVVVTLGVGTCSTNSRIDEISRRMNDGFQNVNRRIDDTNRRMDDGFENVNRRMDDGFENVNRRMDDISRRIDGPAGRRPGTAHPGLRDPEERAGARELTPTAPRPTATHREPTPEHA